MYRKNVHLFLRGYRPFFLQLDSFFYNAITNFPIFPQITESVLIDICCIASDNDVFTPHLFRKYILVFMITIIFSTILFNATAVAQEKRKQRQIVNIVHKKRKFTCKHDIIFCATILSTFDLPKIILCNCLRH